MNHAGAGIDPGMALTPFPSSILDKTSFEPLDHESSSLTASRADCRPSYLQILQLKAKIQT